MPGGDGTGPGGMGSMSGRAAGYCAGYAMPGYMNQGPGRGFAFGRGGGFGRGLGMGRRRWSAPYYGGMPYGMAPVPYTAPTREQELEMLRSQSEGFKQALGDVKKRISELEGNSK